MKCGEIIEKLEQLAPLGMACDWDNPGLLTGRRDKTVKKVFLALDAGDKVIEDAIGRKADMLITHHPLIFKPLEKVNDGDFIGRRVMKLIQNDISYYAMHTNFDAAPGGMADLAAERVGLCNCEILDLEEITSAPKNAFCGIGRIGKLKKDMTLEELGRLVKERFDLPFLTIYGADSVTEPIRKAAISPGSGKGVIRSAIMKGAQVLITGDIGHHDGIDASAEHLAVIDGGHYGLEHIFVDFMEDFLNREMSGLEISKADVVFPAKLL